MASPPKATTSVSDTAGALAAGSELICVWAPVATNADITPRIFGNAAAIYAQHGYSDGLEYSDYHVSKTNKSVLFVGLPIVTVGVVGRFDQTGNTGTATCSVVAGGTGVLGNHDGVVKVSRGGVVGTDQIVLTYSCDGGRTFKNYRLGTGSSFAVPYVNVTVSFVVGGTLVAGDTVLSWHGTSPRSDAAGWALARAANAAQLRLFRALMLIGALQNSTEGNAFVAQVNAYETANERFIRAMASVPDRLPLPAMSRLRAKMTGNPSVTFAEVGASGDTITRATGSFITDGFAVGDIITITGAVITGGANNVTGAITAVSATVLTMGTTDLTPEGPITGVTITGTPAITFAEVGATGDTITRSRGSFLDDGFKVGDIITIAGTALNNLTTDAITAVSATVITLNTADLAAEAIGAASISIVGTLSKAAWVAAREAAFETVTGYRLDLSIGAGRFTSGFSGWAFRRPASWFASAREFQHDLHRPPWRKSDGPVGADLFDTAQNLVEYDDRPGADGGAASAAKFTSLRTWGNGPGGGFVSLSLTRGDDSSLLSQQNNVDVVNLAMTVCQLNTENAAIGVDLILNDDGTATASALSAIQNQVNDALDLALLQDAKGEGQRASKAVWTPSPADLYNVAEPTMNGVLALTLKGTIHFVVTQVRINS